MFGAEAAAAYTAAGAGREGRNNSWAAVTGLDAVKPLRLGPPLTPNTRAGAPELTCAQSRADEYSASSVHVILGVNVHQTSGLNSTLSMLTRTT